MTERIDPTRAGQMIVKGTVVVGDAGVAWVDSDLTPEEERDALTYLTGRRMLGPGASITVTWSRASRLVGTICPRQTCRSLARKVSTQIDEERRSIVNFYGCEACGRTYRIHRGKDRDDLHVIS